MEQELNGGDGGQILGAVEVRDGGRVVGGVSIFGPLTLGNDTVVEAIGSFNVEGDVEVGVGADVDFRGPAGIFGSLHLNTGTRLEVEGPFDVQGAVTGSESSVIVLDGRFSAAMGDPLHGEGYRMQGPLHVSMAEVTLFDADWAELGTETITDRGGLIVSANGVRVPDNGRLEGNVVGAVWAAPGSIVGAGSYGDPLRDDGFRTDGTIQVGEAGSVVVEDGDGAELGPLTELDGGAIRSESGFALDPSEVIRGPGVVVGEIRGGALVPQGVASQEIDLTIGSLPALVLADAATKITGTIAGGELRAPAGVVVLRGAPGEPGFSGFGRVVGDFENDGVVSAEGPQPGDFLEIDGAVTGSGVFTGRIVVPGRVRPDSITVWELAFEDLVLEGSSRVEIELAGFTPGFTHDHIDVSGTAVLDGTLEVQSILGFVPLPGDEFTVLHYGFRVGEFESVRSRSVGSGIAFEPIYEPDRLVLRAVPEVSPAWAGVAALILLSATRMRRFATVRSARRSGSKRARSSTACAPGP